MRVYVIKVSRTTPAYSQLFQLLSVSSWSEMLSAVRAAGGCIGHPGLVVNQTGERELTILVGNNGVGSDRDDYPDLFQS